MYQEATMNIEMLPAHILQNIFVNISDRKILRQVSKTFKEIIDRSPKLMQKYVLNVSTCGFENSAAIHAHYQTIKFQALSIEEMKCFLNYQHKERIKCILIEVLTGDVEQSAMIMQCILFTFENLEHLHIQLEFAEHIWNPSNIKLAANGHSRLRSLKLDYKDEKDGDYDLSNILWMFSEIRTIKKLSVYDLPAEFPKTWDLDELRICAADLYENEDQLMQNVLDTLTPSLRVLEIYSSIDLADYVVRKFPNLEVLHFDVCERNCTMNDEFLVPNDNLRKLTLNNVVEEHADCVERFLKHYRNIEYFSIFQGMAKLSRHLKPIKLHNLSYASLECHIDRYLLVLDAPNLKTLELNLSHNTDVEDLVLVPNGSFKNVEHLSIQCLRNAAEAFFSFLKKFPSLTHLSFYNQGFRIDTTVTNKILEVVPGLKHLGIKEYEGLEPSNSSLEELLLGVYNKGLFLSVDIMKLDY